PDLFATLVLTGVVMALINRLVVRPIRFRGSHSRDAVLILAWIGALVTAMQLDYATKIAEGNPPEAVGEWRPVASALSRIFTSLGAHSPWKDMLDLYTCTECGRCQTHCPAYNTGKPLSPKTLITDLRDLAYEKLAGGYAASTHHAHQVEGGMWVTAENGHGDGAELPGHFQPSWLDPEQVATAVEKAGGAERPLIGGTILDDTLWSCTTCGACMDQCPVLIEHVPKIMDMRRYLVLEESRMPKQ